MCLPGAPVSCWTVCGTIYTMPQRFSFGFKNICLIQALPAHSGHMTLYQEEHGAQKFWQWFWGFHPSRSLTLQGYSLPDHYWPTAKPVMQDDVADISRLFFYLSHVLSVNLFSSLKWTESQWKTYHSSVRVRVPIVSQALWCWFWFSPWAVWSETCRSVACLRSSSRVLTVLLLPLTQRSRYCPSAALMPFYAPVHCTLCIHLQASPPHS